MNGAHIECRRCRGQMEVGFVVDRGHHGTPGIPEWVEGTPEKSFWSGLKTRGRRKLPITTYRCGRCGYLEEYAPSTSG